MNYTGTFMKKINIFQTIPLCIIFISLNALSNNRSEPHNNNSTKHSEHSLKALNDKIKPLAHIVVEFELLNHEGKRVTVKDYQGHYILLLFGFTNCQHICPVGMTNIAQTLNQIDKQAQEQTRGIFISVDTERDTNLVTKGYTSAFGDNIEALGGSHDQIAAAASNFKVKYVVTKTPSTYTVQHTSTIFLIAPDGKIVEAFPFNTPASKMAEVITSHRATDND
jgi:protein SCO1/2